MSLEQFAHDTEIELLSTRDLLALPPPAWLMPPLIPENGMVGLYGAPSGGKSFIALDWAMCISEGLPWIGAFPTKQAPVIYIAAEGGRGIQKRVKAWMLTHNVKTLSAMYWLLNPIYVREEGVVEAFLEKLESLDIYPGLVVFDTLSRSFGNGEENSSADMGHFIDGVIRLATGRQMSALVVHHTNATGNRERGHTSFRGNLDTMFSCNAEKNGDGHIVRIELVNNKQKDGVEADTIYIEPNPNAVGSLVFQVAEPPERKVRGNGPPVPMRKVDMLTLLSTHADGLTWREWQLASGVPKASFSRRLKRLIEDSDIYKDDGRYYATPANVDLAEVDEE